MPESPPDGRVVAGRYRLRQLLGHGGMGSVWSAHDEVLDRMVALKEVKPSPDLTPEQRDMIRRRALREARAAARVSHPSAVTVYDVIDSNDGEQPWIVMQLLAPRTLADALAAGGPLPPAVAAGIGLDLVDALSAAHAAGVLHRDVKPANVMLGEDGRAVLTDFGIATVAGDPTLTSTGMLVGSPGYMAPERARGELPTPASDLWSLGATLYTAVEGESPFRREGHLPTLNAVIHETAPRARHAGRLEPVIARLLARDPAHRPDAAQLRDLLLAIRDAPDEDPPTAEMAATTAIEADPTFSVWKPRAPVPTMLPLPKTKTAAAGVGAVAATAAAATAAAAAAPGQAEPEDEPASEPAPAAPVPAPAPLPAPTTAPASAPVEPPAPTTAPASPPVVTSAPTTASASPPVAASSTTAPASRPVAPPAPTAVPASPPPAAAPPRPAGPPPATPTPARRRSPVAVAALLLVLIVVAAVAFWRPWTEQDSTASPRPSTSTSTPAGPGSAAGQSPNAAPAGTPTPTGTSTATPSATTAAPTATTADPAPDPTGTAAAPVPSGFRSHRDPTGFAVAVPRGWTRSVRGSSVYFRDPDGRSYLQVDTTTKPKSGALSDWKKQEKTVGKRLAGYQRVRLEAVEYRGWGAADWEFTWRASGGTLHVLNRNVRVSDSRAYALLWSVPAGEWADREAAFATIAGTFQPAR